MLPRLLHPLDRKLLRDIYHLRGQVTAIALVVTCGVVTVVTSRVGYQSLEASQLSYYAQYRFADVFASAKRAPDRLVEKVRALPGVESVETRLLYEVTLDVPGLPEPATGRITSVPERRRPTLNDVHLRRGRYIRPQDPSEVLVSEAFAKANHLDLGSRLSAILNGRWTELKIVGIALSPEYIYAIPRSGVFPDNRRFGVLWMGREAVEAAFDMKSAFNDVVVGLEAGANEAEIIAGLDRLLEPYGGRNAYGRHDHVSHRFISDEIAQNRHFGVMLPMLFLGVAAFLLNVLLSRLIATQRDQIGMLKAFGYPHRTVALHYFKLALFGVACGAVLGTGLGFWLGRLINRMYGEIYNFPELRYEMSPQIVAFAIVACTLAALAGAFGAMRRTWSLPPAAAMRPEPPPRFQAGLLERVGLHLLLSPATRMIARNLARRPLRAATASLGIAFAVALLIMGRFFVDSINHLGHVQFDLVQREDVMLATHDPVSRDARHELARLPGVLLSEPYRSVPIELHSGHRSRRTLLMGLPPDSQLRLLIGSTLERVAVPPEGVLLTKKLGEILGVEPGDTLRVEVLEGQRQTRTVTVTGLVDELIGLSAYMDLDAVSRLLGEDGAVSGALLRLDGKALPELWAELKTMPAVAGVGIRSAARQSFYDTISSNTLVFTGVLVVFAVILAFAVVYNTARIALSERGRELASLRVLGFTRNEVSAILLGEQILLALLAIPLGYWFGYQVCASMVDQFAWEVFRMPLIITRDTYIFAFAVIVGACIVSSLIVRRRIDHLDLVEVLKTRE